MMNDDTAHEEGVKLPDRYDFSNGSQNTYLVETRHQLIMPCIHCGQFRPVLLDGNDYYRYFMRGLRIEECFSYLTLQQRELLITGIHPECWDALFADEGDADNEG